MLYNINGADESKPHRRALLLHLPQAFRLSAADPKFFDHHNIRRGQQIARRLGELGYVVDVASGRDARRRAPARPYDLVLCDRADLTARFPRETRKMFLATSANHRAHNRNLRRRHELLRQRRGCGLELRRLYHEEMPYLRSVDAIVAVGGETSAGTWREAYAGPIHMFNNAPFRETQFVADDKAFESARRHFLFFASRSQVQKGLDLLLEVFPGLPDLHLYICSSYEQEADFCACYQKELYQTPNIHPIGWLPVNGREFYELTRRCAYVILPTCSEGQANSVVQGMGTGLIPLVTREAGLDTEDFGVTFADDNLEAIRHAVVTVAGQPPSWHRERSGRVRRVTETTYSETAQVQRWRDILATVVGRSAPEFTPTWTGADA